MNKQEQWWSGPDGDAYSQRNKPDDERAHRFWVRALWSEFGHIYPKSAIEFGANDGRNLRALRKWVCPLDIPVAGVEINPQACKDLAKVVDEHWCGSMLDFKSDKKWDLTFTKGTLIHIRPEQDLYRAYDALYRHSARYILIAEYFSPYFQEIHYHADSPLLWRGPYAEEMSERMDLKLLDYGFISKLDEWPEDDLTWWLMKKK